MAEKSKCHFCGKWVDSDHLSADPCWQFEAYKRELSSLESLKRTNQELASILYGQNVRQQAQRDSLMGFRHLPPYGI